MSARLSGKNRKTDFSQMVAMAFKTSTSTLSLHTVSVIVFFPYKENIHAGRTKSFYNLETAAVFIMSLLAPIKGECGGSLIVEDLPMEGTGALKETNNIGGQRRDTLTHTNHHVVLLQTKGGSAGREKARTNLWNWSLSSTAHEVFPKSPYSLPTYCTWIFRYGRIPRSYAFSLL